ncbi:tetratricopeptide repeat protein [Maridesulfovibrio hydrothermalis]|uniref:TPR repeat-containing protein n=1 Tax=Maridesulfovibrio hydrothermalis AM13 = DSM 14728 TaxID=1121451 RepID=L0RBA6_9BACT|nr:tetratricopeptide repeat protein [Maridesulfovibrio hydrothermalis]CCO22856.1 TPR repeat-containing protein [Maridesulfovibrio hydrothermalis AM13 = DSM 14728]
MAPAEQATDRKKIQGVFSSQNVQKIGTGTTVRRTISKMYWMAKELDDGTVEVQALNTSYIPAGPKSTVPLEEFLSKYSPEPEFYVSTVFPKMKELNSTIERGEKARQAGATYSAEFEFQNAVSVDEDNVKANFGLGLTYMERGETNKANDIFERLVKLDAAFQTEHKHLFNEFGINLRKTGMQDQALDYYERALEMTKQDENLHYNIARAYFEKGMLDKCADHLTKALAINKDHPEAGKFLEFVKKAQQA